MGGDDRRETALLQSLRDCAGLFLVQHKDKRTGWPRTPRSALIRHRLDLRFVHARFFGSVVALTLAAAGGRIHASPCLRPIPLSGGVGWPEKIDQQGAEPPKPTGASVPNDFNPLVDRRGPGWGCRTHLQVQRGTAKQQER